MKSPWLAALLGFVLGPLGLLYVSLSWGCGLFIFAVVISFFTAGIGGLGTWIACGFAGYFLAIARNKELARSVAAGQAPFGALGANALPPAMAVSSAGKFCTSCGAALSSAARFCGKCGASQ